MYKGLSAVKYSENQTLTNGIKALVKLKIEEHETQTLQSRIRKLSRDEAKTKRKIDQVLRQTEFISKI